MLPDWQLPPGVDRGLWDYVSSERVAREYDQALAGTPLLQLDVEYAARHLTPPGKLVDLGCGTGRLVLHFARLGYACLGIDLSAAMLDEARTRAIREGLAIEWLQANLVELEAIPAADFDHAACLFSTLGMLRGDDARQRFLAHVRRILRPGGNFVLHAHNAGYRLGFGLGKRGKEPGDRTMPQVRGGAELTIHHFKPKELAESLHRAGFRIVDWQPVSPTGPLSRPWLWPGIRSYGFLVTARPH